MENAGMHGYLQRLHEEIAAAMAGMNEEDLSRHPEGKWCVAQILEHLYLTYTGTAKGCERCLAEDRPMEGESSFRQGLRKLVVLRLNYLPGGREAPPHTRPKGMPPQQVSQEITRKISEMDEMLARCEEKFGPHTRFMNHPVLGPLTATEWRKFHWVHGRHHVRQILALRVRA